VGRLARLALASHQEANKSETKPMTPRPFYRRKSFWLGVLFLALCGLLLWGGSIDEDALLKRHLGSLERSKATRIEIDFERDREWAAWFYVEAPTQVIADILKAEGFTEGVSQKDVALSWISRSSEMPSPPTVQSCHFFSNVPADRGVFYYAVTDERCERAWIVALRY
jgi:hypothetical protein